MMKSLPSSILLNENPSRIVSDAALGTPAVPCIVSTSLLSLLFFICTIR